MERRISEADWQCLRRLEPAARDRFCRRVLAEVARLAADPALDVAGLVRERDAELGPPSTTSGGPPLSSGWPGCGRSGW